jgi:adenylate kinase
VKRNLIFVGGVHGVGKTWLCDALSDRLGFEHLSASALIRKAQHAPATTNKSVKNVDENQVALLNVLDDAIQSNKAYIMDGHFCLWGEDGQIVDIPDAIYAAISPKAIITVYDEPDAVILRLKNRDNKGYSLKLLTDFQIRELARAKEIADSLGIPMYSYKARTELVPLVDIIRSL